MMQSTQIILVIDDEPDVGKFIAAAAQTVGLHCAVTSDVDTFLESLTSYTTLILLDLMMPGRDGIEVLRLLNERRCNVPIVLMSGVGDRVLESAEQLAQSLGLTIVGHLNKPFRLKELQAVLTKSAALSASPGTKSQQRHDITDEELRIAVDRNQFVLHYQPQVEIATGNVIGLEALVRWQHPARGLIFPDNFIGRAEELSLIDRLGWIVYERAMREAGQFANNRDVLLTLSLNVSLRSLKDLEFTDRFVALIERSGLNARNITVEITESGLLEELSTTLDVLTRLRMKKVSLSIDDFGTGYAMMQQLRAIPATELKIDKSFIQKTETSARDRVIVQKSIEMGHELDMKIVAEGVETQEQFEFLRANRCDAVQGYLFSRPQPPESLLGWLREYGSPN
jgi:EAL domain-containing protein (putative c-di-GMP-specific phosphodiesterase class I)/CheY-like chemotaxis protein